MCSRACKRQRLGKSNGYVAMTLLHNVPYSFELFLCHLSYQQGQGRTNFGVCMSYILRCGHPRRLMCPGADKWRLRKTNGNRAMTRPRHVLSCLAMLQHHLSHQQGQGRTNFGVCMSYILRCSHPRRLMCPGADKWRLAKLNGNVAMTRPRHVLSCLGMLQHHLSHQQGQGRTNFGVCMSYILRCGHWWRLMCPGADKWRLAKLNGNRAMTRPRYVPSCLGMLQHHLSHQQGQGR